MAKELGEVKYDPNTEAFQMRAQWKKVDICRKQWFDRWSWLLDERKQALQESDAIRQEAADALPHVMAKAETTKSLKPVPITSTGVIGWLAAK
ncbi:uncharacterized protein LOC123705134 isoform X2 [Colias croceus]|nr:uncharacterized protein LOC123705134 isoform X2 [Colias croceus]